MFAPHLTNRFSEGNATGGGDQYGGPVLLRCLRPSGLGLKRAAERTAAGDGRVCGGFDVKKVDCEKM